MGAQEISNLSLGICFLLLLVPLAIFSILKIRLIRITAWSAFRMAVQLALVGVFLEYLFEWNNGLLNAAWLFVMVLFAALSVVGSSGLRYRDYLLPTLSAFLLSALTIVTYFNGLVVRVDSLLDARYLIAVSGMALGNSLQGTIIGLRDFYGNVRRNENRYFFSLAAGATRHEALAPYIRSGITAALRPSLANMATMGVVLLPGMMTGQILSGESPMGAIKYQMAIAIVIFTCVLLAVTLTVLFTVGRSFDGYGMLKPEIFRTQRRIKGNRWN